MGLSNFHLESHERIVIIVFQNLQLYQNIITCAITCLWTQRVCQRLPKYCNWYWHYASTWSNEVVKPSLFNFLPLNYMWLYNFWCLVTKIYMLNYLWLAVFEAVKSLNSITCGFNIALVFCFNILYSLYGLCLSNLCLWVYVKLICTWWRNIFVPHEKDVKYFRTPWKSVKKFSYPP